MSSDPNDNLICPLSHDYLEEPITIPCCGKLVSRDQLLQWFQRKRDCPLCNHDLTNFDAANAATVKPIVYLVEEAKKAKSLQGLFVDEKNDLKKDSKWKAVIHRLHSHTHRTIIGQLSITNANDKFRFKTLLIPVIDRSGSMVDSFHQAIYSLNRIVDMTFQHRQLITHIVSYNDRAISFEIDTHLPQQTALNQVNALKADGGTSFTSAFNEIVNVIDRYKTNTQISSVVICVMTDGEDSSVVKSQRINLVNTLKSSLASKWSKSLTIHSIGFTSAHDFDFLNNLRQIGTAEGAYRFADPLEDSDSLSNKINSLLNVIVQSSTIPIKLTKSPFKVISGDNDKYWLNLTNCDLSATHSITINVNGDETIDIDTQFAEDENKADVQESWYTYLIDEIASEVLMLSTKPESLDKQVHCELLENRSKYVMINLKQDGPNFTRLQTLTENLKTIKKGGQVDQMKLTDTKSEGKYQTQVGSKQLNLVIPMASVALARNVAFVRPTWKYIPWISKRRSPDKTNELCKLVANSKYSAIREHLKTHEVDAVSFMYACRIGRNEVVKLLIANKQDRYFVSENKEEKGDQITLIRTKDTELKSIDGFNAMDLTIIYSNYRTYDVLLGAGFKPSIDGQVLLMTCLQFNHLHSAERLIKNKFAVITDEMIRDSPSVEVINWLMSMSSKEVDIETAISKGMIDTVKNNVGKIENFSWNAYQDLFSKPNAGQIETIKFLVEAKIADPCEVMNVTNDDKPDITWPLFLISASGQLELCKFFLEHMPNPEFINKQTLSGTSCLWISSCSGKLDIVMELLNRGADPNLPRLNGDSALVAVCQKGYDSVAELLLAAGARLDVYNPERDNPVLICCRNGKHVILEMFFKHLEKDPVQLKFFMNLYAEIDFFPPLLASAELNRTECMKVCLKYGADIEYKTADDNKVIGGATSLHLATFYNRFDAVKLLCEYKCNAVEDCITRSQRQGNILAQTSTGQTALHIAIKAGHIYLVRYLLSLPEGKQCLTIVDAEGRLPAYYAGQAGNESLKEEFFTNHLAATLERILTANQTDEVKCSDVLVRYGQSLGCFEFDDITKTSIRDGAGILTYALLNGSKSLVSALEQMGADYQSMDDYKVSPAFWSAYLGYETKVDEKTQLMLDRVQLVKNFGLQNKMLLSLNIGIPLLEDKSDVTVAVKMNDGYMANVPTEILKMLHLSRSQQHSILGFIDKLKKEKLMAYILFDAKMHAIRLIASGREQLSPVHLMVLYLYTGNLSIFKQVNENLTKTNSSYMPFIQTLYQALHQLPNYTNEVYRAVDLPFNADYKIGECIKWTSFSMCSKLTNECGTLINKCKGMVFVIKGRVSKDISLYSKFPVDEEVVFMPGTVMKIVAFYRPRITALTQANIRHTLVAEEKDMERAIKGRASLIIELEEVVEDGMVTKN